MRTMLTKGTCRGLWFGLILGSLRGAGVSGEPLYVLPLAPRVATVHPQRATTTNVAFFVRSMQSNLTRIVTNRTRYKGRTK